MTMPNARRILIIDDDDAFAGDLGNVVTEANYKVYRATDRETSMRFLAEKQILVVLLGMSRSQEKALDELRRLKTRFPYIEVIIFNWRGDFKAAFAAMRMGAYDFLVKSSDMNEFVSVIDKAFGKARSHYRRKSGNSSSPRKPKENFAEMVGKSSETQKVQSMIGRMAPTNSPILISGETGVGKDLAARMIHRLSKRKGGPFIAINCGAIPDTLLENELFGHAKGAFTDSLQTKPGLIEEADGGTLFLDEVSEICPAMQAKFLRILETWTFRRLGDNKERNIDVRIVAATNRNLSDDMKEGKFRVDFYYRLAVMLIDIPPLRKRREDIPLLVNHFLKLHFSGQKNLEKKLSHSAMQLLTEYDWPGNIREVHNVVERLSVLTNSATITPADMVNVINLPNGGQEIVPASQIKEAAENLANKDTEKKTHSGRDKR